MRNLPAALVVFGLMTSSSQAAHHFAPILTAPQAPAAVADQAAEPGADAFTPTPPNSAAAPKLRLTESVSPNGNAILWTPGPDSKSPNSAYIITPGPNSADGSSPILKWKLNPKNLNGKTAPNGQPYYVTPDQYDPQSQFPVPQPIPTEWKARAMLIPTDIAHDIVLCAPPQTANEQD